MLRVAYIFERFPSFSQTFCYREVAELERQGAEVTVFSIRCPDGEPPQDWDEEIVRRVHYLPGEAELVREVERADRKGKLPDEARLVIKDWDRQPDFLRLYQAAYIGQRLQKAGIQRVHAHFAGMAARTAYWIHDFFGVDYSVTAHANDIFAPRDFVVSLGKLVDAAVGIVTVSDFSLDQLKQRFPRNARKMHRVYNGVDLNAFRAAEFDRAVPLIISIGRLIEKKGFSDLVSACALLRERDLPFQCEIIGEGPLEQALCAQIGEAQLGDRVQLQGSRNQAEIAGRLAYATVFALPCTTEADGGMDNLPTVIMEAMASGLPVVSTPLAGVPEMVEAGVTGELVPQRNPSALADALAALISRPERARELGSRGREVAGKKFAIETNVKMLAAILQQLS